MMRRASTGEKGTRAMTDAELVARANQITGRRGGFTPRLFREWQAIQRELSGRRAQVDPAAAMIDANEALTFETRCDGLLDRSTRPPSRRPVPSVRSFPMLPPCEVVDPATMIDDAIHAAALVEVNMIRGFDEYGALPPLTALPPGIAGDALNCPIAVALTDPNCHRGSVHVGPLVISLRLNGDSWCCPTPPAIVAFLQAVDGDVMGEGL